jgi:hypothetical protein
MDDNNKQAQFLPFHAINEFMRSDYRFGIVRTALVALPTLPRNLRAPIDRITKKTIKVTGFRNSAKSPAAVRTKPTADAFEKNPDLVAAILSAWAETKPELRQQVYDLLIERGWEVLPPDADRTKLPGFLPVWPKNEDFDTLNNAFFEKYAHTKHSNDDISLMVVWISSRLPYDVESSEEDSPTEQEDSR